MTKSQKPFLNNVMNLQVFLVYCLVARLKKTSTRM
jgi:hypothetical protein